jgi:hypothetical protein
MNRRGYGVATVALAVLWVVVCLGGGALVPPPG